MIKNKNQNIILFFVLIFNLSIFLSCLNHHEKKENQKFYTITAIGEINKDSYTFCGITPKKIEYTYRIGTWTFLTKNKLKIAEGNYDIIFEKIDSIGGCDFSYYKNIVNLKKWSFWGLDGKKIEVTNELLDLIKSKETQKIVFLK